MEDFDDSKIISKLNVITEYLETVKPIIDSHMVLFFTEQYWSTLIPKSIQIEFECLGAKEFSSVFWNCGKVDLSSEYCEKELPDCANLVTFLCDARRLYIGSLDIILTCQELKDRLSAVAGESHGRLKSEQFMSPKKSHEVEVMGEVASMLAAVSGATHVVDVGGGKGYLSSALAMHHGLPVLGVDSCRSNTAGAARHSHKLQKAWGYARKEIEEARNDESQSASNDTTADCNYKLTTQFVSADVGLSRLVQDHFADASDCRVCVVGLHTCGDLAAACLRAFCADKRLVALCGVGCCYNLLGEAGFPVSSHLQRAGFTLGRNARMLAAQAMDRIVEKQQLAVESLFYRALLEILLIKNCSEDTRWGHVGRLAAKCKNFQEYVHKAIAKLGVDVKVSDDEIEELYTLYLPQRDQLQAFFSLRIALGPVVETVLLLDRLLYLHEQAIKT